MKEKADMVMANGVTLVQVGEVSVLVFSTPELRKRIGDLLANATEHTTRIAIADDGVADTAVYAAMAEVRKQYPLPPYASHEPVLVPRT